MSTQIKEKPIIFSGSMVKAILKGRKFQTRRVLKPQPMDYYPSWYPNHTSPKRKHYAREKHWRAGGPVDFSPYGKAGDHLWVREGHAFCPKTYKPSGVIYRADGKDDHVMTHEWRPSIHMFRKDSRITLEVEDVLVERVQDISEDDALEEGVFSEMEYPFDDGQLPCPACGGQGLHGAFGENYGVVEVECEVCDTLVKRFQILWNAINSKRGFSWESNPFVWVVSFKRIKP